MRNFKKNIRSILLMSFMFVLLCFSSCTQASSEENGKWTKAVNIKYERYSHNSVILNDEIYVAGGFNMGGDLKSVEMYEPEKDIWTKVANLNVPRDTINSVVLNDKIYVIGGSVGEDVINSVEIYDSENIQD